MQKDGKMMYANKTIEEKREIRNCLETIKANRLSQIEGFEAMVKPLKDNLKKMDDFKKGIIPFEFFAKHCILVNKHLEDCFKCKTQ